jgi:hypothetical protein
MRLNRPILASESIKPSGDAEPNPSRQRWRARALSGLVALTVIVASSSLSARRPQPIIGPAALSPTNTVYNTPTLVRFTALIDTPTLNPTTVRLVQVKADGTAVRTVARMYDNGQRGDAIPGDKTFTANVVLNEAEIGRIYFLVTADFRGGHQTEVSAPIPFDVDPFKLPPDPGEAGKQTLSGIDSDTDGIRDDVQRYIAYATSDSAQRRALAQLAKANQDFILNSSAAKEVIIPIVVSRHHAQECLFGTTPDAAKVIRLQRQIRAQLLNTRERSLAYVRADALLSGSFFPPPDPAQFMAACK